MMMEIKKPSIKSKVEAVLFSAGYRIGLEEISKLCRATREDVLAALNELKKEYDEKQSSLMLVEENNFWKFTVRDQFVPIVKRIVTETELTKSVLETLAVIAFKYPILQSDLIKIRTNKAYDHLTELEAAGYISRQKHGRTNLIKLTDKFFRYFDLTEEKLRGKFKDFESIAKAIKEKEEEVEHIKEEQHKMAEELKKQDEKIKKEIEELDEIDEEYKVPLDTYETKESLHENTAKEDKGKKISDLEVVEVQQKQEESVQKEDKEEALVDENKIEAQQKQIQKIDEKKSKGIKLTPEQEVRVDKRVEEIVQGKESKEEKKVV